MKVSKRKLSIDQARGFTIFLMIIVDYVVISHTLASFIKYAQEQGFALVYVAFPLFLFTIGLSKFVYRVILVNAVKYHKRIIYG